MLSIQEIKKYYNKELHAFDSFILREYLQYKILEIVFESKYANKLCFLGGTCLRIIHNNQRFSEDLDFDNFGLTENDFLQISQIIQLELNKQGYLVEIKNVYSGAFHCYVKFPNILYNHGVSGHREEKILIQLDTEPQNFKFTPNKVILNKFDVFTSINTTPIDLLLSQKIYALINRKRKKGRDFYDIIFLFKMTNPNYSYINQKIGVKTKKELKEIILFELKEINLYDISEDVEPFLFNAKDKKQILMFKEYIKQVLE